MIALVEQYIDDFGTNFISFLITYIPILLFSIPFLVLIYYLIYKFVKRHKNNINNYWNHDNRQG